MSTKSKVDKIEVDFIRVNFTEDFGSSEAFFPVSLGKKWRVKQDYFVSWRQSLLQSSFGARQRWFPPPSPQWYYHWHFYWVFLLQFTYFRSSQDSCSMDHLFGQWIVKNFDIFKLENFYTSFVVQLWFVFVYTEARVVSCALWQICARRTSILFNKIFSKIFINENCVFPAKGLLEK